MAFETMMFQHDQSSYNTLMDHNMAPTKDLSYEATFNLDLYNTLGVPNDNIFTPARGEVDRPLIGSAGRAKRRRRARRAKSKEEVENQRTTHITVERNRRKQMNDYLIALRSIMPSSYVQRGDQASIIGAAINFVKELEQVVHSLAARKRATEDTGLPGPVFSDFFIFPQYSTKSTAEMKRSSTADLEVTMVENHANVKVMMMKGHQKQLSKMVVGLELLGLAVLHLNVTTFEAMVLYSFSVKVEEDCELSSVNEISASVYELVRRIQEDPNLFTSL